MKYVDGLYEEVVSLQAEEILKKLPEESKYLEDIDPVEAPGILAKYVEQITKKKLQSISEKSKDVFEQIKLVNQIIAVLQSDAYSKTSNEDHRITERGQLLRTINNNLTASILKQTAQEIKRPVTSVAQTSLFTNALREPNLSSEIRREIASCDSVDIMVSFIKWSGMLLIFDELKKFANSGKNIRIITTSYMGVTELRAIAKLAELPNVQIKVSYDTERTRLHAKVYIFRRNTGYSTAYVGSSNLTAPAMTTGCEWNIKVTQNDLPEVFKKIDASYNGYWESQEFEIYSYEALKEALTHSQNPRNKESHQIFYLDVHPYPYQKAILDKLDTERNLRHSYRNLICAATGTGKTVIAALDYRKQCQREKRALKLLFIAHRKEILDQSLMCFRTVMKDSEFGDVFYGGNNPQQLDHIFISIQTLNSRGLTQFAPNKYDYIIFDECHHTAASSYKMALEYFQPQYLLGLTATPERMDGEDILPFFNNRIAAEIRLPEAIDRKLLCPFYYFGVADSVDLSEISWSRRGYDLKELESAYISNKEIAEKRFQIILQSLEKYIANIEKITGLAFCVSIEHAKYMSDKFNEAGIQAAYLTSASNDKERNEVRKQLEIGSVKIVCVVDLYNEGVDIRSINTILFLRPTESLTVFLQQLGRGLRLAENKDNLTVLDFIGQANKKYNKFEEKFKALMPICHCGCKKEINDDFPHLPRGCYIRLEKKAKEYILENIRKAVSNKARIIDKLLEFCNEVPKNAFSFLDFFNAYNITPPMIYRHKITATSIIYSNAIMLDDEELPKKMFRLTALDSTELLAYLIENFKKVLNIVDLALTEQETAYWRIVYATFIDVPPQNELEIRLRLQEYWQKNQQIIPELLDVLRYQFQNIDFEEQSIDLPYPCILKTYCTYTRAQALSALNYWRTSSEGVTRVKEKKTTFLFVTLNKSDHFYSPSTAYHDYSINEQLFHWQSQNSTADNTEVGQRYINHESLGESILLFIREQKTDSLGPVPFTLLGKVTFDNYTGNKPMNIIWKLERPIPARFLKITDKLGID